ncbi:MAG: hypothetical protein V3U60_16635 [Gammaproteobacteria bacterium]
MNEHNQQIFEMYRIGLSYRAMAKELGISTGVVSGTIMRHLPADIPKRGTPGGGEHRAKRRATVKKAETHKATPKPETPEELKLRQSPSGCRSIDGDPKHKDWFYCQQARIDGSSFCAYHHAKYYISFTDAKAAKKRRRKIAASPYHRKLSRRTPQMIHGNA